MAAGSWKGHLRLSLVSCPVRLSPAFSESTRIHLHILNAKTQNRVHQFLRDAETGEEVEREDTVRGYEYDKDRYVVLDESDLDKAQGSLDSAHIIDLDRFVADDEIDDIYFDSPYWVVPDGRLAEETYSVIAEAMRDKGRAAVGRLTLTSRERPVLLRPRDKGMILTTLRSPEELKEEADRMAKIKLREGDDEMVKLAGLIIDKKTGEFDPELFEDRYQVALRTLIDAKIKGRRPALKKAARPAKVVDLFDALKRSLEAEPAPAKAAAKPARKPAKTPRKPAAASPRRKAS